MTDHPPLLSAPYPPQDRVTDHRVGLSVQGVERVLGGEALGAFVDRLAAASLRPVSRLTRPRLAVSAQPV